MTKNDELASIVGQDRPCKDGARAYDAKYGVYSSRSMPTPNVAQAESTVRPFGALKAGR